MESTCVHILCIQIGSHAISSHLGVLSDTLPPSLLSHPLFYVIQITIHCAFGREMCWGRGGGGGIASDINNNRVFLNWIHLFTVECKIQNCWMQIGYRLTKEREQRILYA